jgi:hypothetical protein
VNASTGPATAAIRHHRRISRTLGQALGTAISSQADPIYGKSMSRAQDPSAG